MARTLTTLIDDEGRARVERAVKAAEERSTGEIVPAIVERSGGYADARLRGALLASGITTLALVLARPHAALGWLVLAQAVGLVAGYVLSAAPPVLRALAGRAALARAAHDRAVRAFLEHGLAHTANRTGVLVFASRLEREVVILGDEAIHRTMGEGEWRRAVDALIAGLRRSAPADGFCDAIAIVGAKLAEHFPSSDQGGPDELPNRLEIEDS